MLDRVSKDSSKDFNKPVGEKKGYISIIVGRVVISIAYGRTQPKL